MATGLSQGKQTGGLANWRRAILDFLFPPRCVGCARRGAWLCPDCRAALPRLPADRCLRCGSPLRRARAATEGPGPPARRGGQAPALRSPNAPLSPLAKGPGAPSVCSACRHAGYSLDGLSSGYSFEGALRAAIHQLKYRRARHLAGPLGELLVESFEAVAPGVDVLVPVPLHPSRQAERGFNQSALLAAELARVTGLPLVDGPLVRTRPTEPQMRLPANRRLENVAGAFAVRGRALAGRRVLLVDDVCTTGSTLEACAEALKAGGAASVWGLTLARAR